MGVVIKNVIGKTQGVLTKSQARKMQRKEKKDAKLAKRQAHTFYRRPYIDENDQERSDYKCCSGICASRYGCSLTLQANVPMIQFFRNKFLELSRETKRNFIAHRLKSKNVELDFYHRVLLKTYK